MWIKNGEALYLNKEKVQNLITQQRTNLAEVSNLDLNSVNNIIQNFENPSLSEKNPEKTFGDSKINWDNKNGMGAMGDNANIDYRGFQIELSAKDFRNLTPSGRTTSDLTNMKQAIANGNGVASPTIFADWNEQKKRWEITGHEGRSRSDAISELYGSNTLMPVHVIPYKLRANDITPEMLNAPFIGQDLSKYDWATEYKFENNRRAVKNQNTLKLSLPGDRGDTSLAPVDYRRSIDPLFDFFMEYSDNGVLNPGSAHIGEDFSGSFISPEFVAFSIKRKQGKNESDATYRKYLERRQSALENASGTSLDNMAAEYVRKYSFVFRRGRRR